MTRTVSKVLIVNEKNEALMLRRSHYPSRPERSRIPDLPGGRVDPGENELEAAVRESFEEAGIHLSKTELTLLNHGVVETDTDGRVTKYLFGIRLNFTPTVQLSYEHEAFEWSDLRTFADTYRYGEFYDTGIRRAVQEHLI